MRKTKKEMNVEEEEERQDNLEIASIGSLYRGPWDKKYWSSSRGKDRYPYPIGYQAVRSHGGKICKMEIREGINGPQFVITTSDGPSCSGQTPDIAWGKYQRKGQPYVKSLNEKRLTCKIDGVEFFGFKNPFVQRLLRELVAGVSRTTDKELLSSSPFNGAIERKQDTHCTISCASSDLLSLSEKPRVTGQRSKKRHANGMKMSGSANLVSCQPQDLSCVLDVPMIRKQDHKFHYDGNLINTHELEKEHQILSHPGVSSPASDLQAAVPEENRQPAQNVHNDLSSDLPLCRSSMKEDNSKEACLTKDDAGTEEENSYAPDTLDFLHENSSGPPTSSPEESSSIVKDEIISGNMGSAEESPVDSIPETAGISVSDAGSQKNENDSVSEDVTKSMMSLLLPQALPLLKKTYKRKRRRTVSPSEVSLTMLKFPQEKDSARVEHVSTAAMQIENALGNCPDRESSEPLKSIIPDGFENYGYCEHMDGQAVHSNIGEVDPDNAKHSCTECGEACPVSEEKTLLKELSVCHVDNSNDADVLLPTVNMLSKERSQGTDVLAAGSAFSDIHSNKETPKRESLDSHRDLSETSEQQTFIDSASSSNLEGFVKLVGLYVHPMPVLSVVLSMKETGIHICTLCGSLDGEDRKLFMYKLDITDSRVGCPSFVGYSSITMPFLNCSFDRENTMVNSSLQFSPDGWCLVLLNSIKVPQCREGKIQCPCSECTSDSFEENVIKIVQLKFGFVSVITKLKTEKNITCILVCEPDHLVAVEEGATLHLWAMNSSWSAMTEEFIMPTYDCLFPSVVELKQMPMCSHLILGHNGIGEFGFWDISRRVLVSRFSAPTISVTQIMPISLFSCDRNNPPFQKSSSEQIASSMIGATKIWYSDQTENSAFILLEEQEIAIWLLISTGPDSHFQSQYGKSCQMNSSRCWRLGLLVKNKAVFGTPFVSSAVAVGALADHGILATDDGLVSMWELSTGNKICTLHQLKGNSIPTITTDVSKRSGAALAIADGGELLVYLYPMSNFTPAVNGKLSVSRPQSLGDAFPLYSVNVPN